MAKTRTPKSPEHQEDVFQGLILREVLLAEGLKRDIDFAGIAPMLGAALAVPASKAVGAFVKSTPASLLSMPAQGLTKAAIVKMFTSNNSLAALRSARKLWQQVKPSGTDESAAHSCFRAALAYAVQGEYDKAEEWLIDGEKLVGDLARPHFIRGLMHGAQGRTGQAESALVKALDGRAKSETKVRIQEALSLLAPAST